MKKVLVSFLIIITLFVSSCKVNAETLQGMYNQLEELEKQQANIENGRKLTESQITSLQKEIVNVNATITNTEAQIRKSTQEIYDSEQEIEEKKDEIVEMLKYLQISNNESSYLEYLLESDNYVDFVYRYAIVTQMTNRNNELIEQEELTVHRQTLSTKLATLNANLNELQEEGTSIADDIKSLKRDISKYEKLGCTKTETINSCIIRTQSVPTAYGWNLPIASGIITSQYQVYRTDCYNCGGTSHRGIDIGVAEGTPVYASAEGTVALTITSGSSLSCGGIKVYLYHNVNGTLYTTVVDGQLLLEAVEDMIGVLPERIYISVLLTAIV